MADPLTDFKARISALHRSLQSAKASQGKEKQRLASAAAQRRFASAHTTDFFARAVATSLNELSASAWSLAPLHSSGKRNEKVVMTILESILKLEKLHEESNYPAMLSCLEEIAECAVQLVPQEQPPAELVFSLPRFPASIEPELMADIRELKRCFSASCYRSAVILCGRVLETTLHRKYYEATGNDILETNPGIGLGTIIAKLEGKLSFDPGIKDQIHLINKVRISSVHKQSEPFYPTKEQAHAIILYTMDVVSRLFS